MNHILIILIALALPGLLLLIWGFRGRRFGTEPRCRHCDYDLTGLEHLTCPECGTDHTNGSVRIGTRKRRRGVIALGATLVAIGMTVGVAHGWGVDWFRCMPLEVVLRLASAGHNRAIAELERRYVEDTLSVEEVSRVTTCCLRMQARSTAATPWQRWINLLHTIDAEGRLTSEQRQTYRMQLIGPHRFAVRSPIAVGDPLVMKFTYLQRHPRGMIVPVGLSPGPLHVDGVRFHYVSTESPRFDGVREVSMNLSSPVRITAGVHTIEFQAEIEVYDTPYSITVTSPVEVVDREGGVVRLVRDEEMGAKLLAALNVRSIGLKQTLHDRIVWRWAVHLDAVRLLPIAVAFDICVRNQGIDHKIGSFWCAEGSTDCGGDFAPFFDGQRGEREIVLRANPDVARQTVDLHEVWDGELIFGPIPTGIMTAEDMQARSGS